MGVGRCRLSTERMVVPLPWLSWLPVGEDCPELLTVLREPALGAPTLYCLPEGIGERPRDLPFPEFQVLLSICKEGELTRGCYSQFSEFEGEVGELLGEQGKGVRECQAERAFL